MNIRVLVVDDDLFVRQSLQKMLSRTPGISTVGFAENGTQALEIFTSEAVDLVLMDVQLPDMDGVSTAAEIHALEPEARVLMFSSRCDQNSLRKAIGAGASGISSQGRGAGCADQCHSRCCFRPLCVLGNHSRNALR